MKTLMSPFDITRPNGPRRLDVPLCVAGAGATSTWFTLFHTRIEPFATADPTLSEAALDAVIVLACLACALFSKRRGGLARSTRLVCCTCAAGALGTALLIAGSQASVAAFYFGSAVGTVATTVLLLMWNEFFARLSPARTALCVSCSVIAGEILRIAMLGLVPVYFNVALALLPVLSTLTLVQAFRTLPEEPQAKSDPAGPSVPVWLVACLAAYALCYGLVAKTGTSSVALTSLSKALPALLVIVALSLQSERFTFNDVYRLGMPLAVCGGALSCAFAGMDPAVANFFVTFGFLTCRILVTVGLGAAARAAGGGAAYLFGIQVAAQYSASLVGKVAQARLSQALPQGVWGLVVLTACLVAATIALLMMRDKTRLGFVWGTADVSDSSEDANSSRKLGLQQASQAFGLSDREVEVLRLLLEGMTLGQIGRELCIAEGTVKSHTSRIYRKMGISGRSEVADALPNAEKTPR